MKEGVNSFISVQLSPQTWALHISSQLWRWGRKPGGDLGTSGERTLTSVRRARRQEAGESGEYAELLAYFCYPAPPRPSHPLSHFQVWDWRSSSSIQLNSLLPSPVRAASLPLFPHSLYFWEREKTGSCSAPDIVQWETVQFCTRLLGEEEEEEAVYRYLQFQNCHCHPHSLSCTKYNIRWTSLPARVSVFWAEKIVEIATIIAIFGIFPPHVVRHVILSVANIAWMSVDVFCRTQGTEVFLLSHHGNSYGRDAEIWDVLMRDLTGASWATESVTG